jgi:hypothetical protein
MNIWFPIYVQAALEDYKYIIPLFIDKLSPHSAEKQKINDRLEMLQLQLSIWGEFKFRKNVSKSMM